MRPSLTRKKKAPVRIVTVITCVILAAVSILIYGWVRLGGHVMVANIDSHVLDAPRKTEVEESNLRNPTKNVADGEINSQSKPQTALSNQIDSTFSLKISEEKIDSAQRVESLGGGPQLTAYLEPTLFGSWDVKPLPVRTNEAANLVKVTFPKLNSCSKLPSQWPVDDFPDADPFLPWIHDVFPSDDGHFIRFVAQNKRRCHTGKQMGEFKKNMQPQIAIFQSVPVKRVSDSTSDSTTRYKLSSYEEADEDGMETRFICRFKPSMQETLSTFPVSYDYHTVRKGYKSTFTEEGFDNHMIWTSQLMFDCPVPRELRSVVSDGSTVVDDYATMFLDLVPIRTPVRYGPPTSFLPPRFEKPNTFNAKEEWGENHLLPLIENSGRWENIPICKSSLKTYGRDEAPTLEEDEKTAPSSKKGTPILNMFENENLLPFSTNLYQPQRKIHNLIGCTWASTSFATRGERALINDGKRRLHEWLSFHFMAGFDHIYIYDNSGAFSDTDSLKSVTDLFPGRVTRIDWPSKVCNNRPNNVDDKGERSSQYAAETSCRLRFGAHSEWLGAMDTDEYLVPQGEYMNLKDLLKDLSKEGLRIFSFHSQRARPRFNKLAPPKLIEKGGVKSFSPEVSVNSTFLETYNCHRDKPRKDFVPAEKQIYKPDYVLLHHVHYSTMTLNSQLSQSQTRAAGYGYRQRYQEQHVRFSDEEKEGLMLHSKSVVESQTRMFVKHCKKKNDDCKLGFAWPDGEESTTNTRDEDGNFYNCFVDEKIESYWIPKLNDEMKKNPLLAEYELR